MTDERTSRFGGVGARIAWGAVSPVSLVTGIAVALEIAVLAGPLHAAGARRAAELVAAAVLIAAQAHFAVQGLHGRTRGTFAVPSSWAVEARVAATYVALQLAWIVPLALWISALRGGPAEPFDPRGGLDPLALVGGRALVLGVLVLIAGWLFAPPLLLAGAAAAERFQDVFRPSHWRRLLEGRSSDLFAVYALYVGPLVLVVTLIALVCAGALAMGRDPAIVVAVTSAVFLAGMSVALLGRLAGAFAAGEGTFEPAASEVPRPLPTALQPANPQPAVPSGPPVLLDASARVAQLRQLFATDRAGALAELENLRAAFAPSPQVLHALCTLRLEAGDVAGASSLAPEAARLAFERGHSALAAQIFAALLPHRVELGLSNEQFLALAEQLAARGDYRSAASCHAGVLRRDPGTVGAVKGLMAIARSLVEKERAPEQAVRILRFLLETCPESPLAPYMREELERAERLARVHA